jgi:ABC-type multidrug transport system ATPase subunit
MVVEIENLRMSFGRFEALRGLSLSVPQGSALALIGANGAGKTTTIRLLMNIIAPTFGRATVLGVDTRALSAREFAQIGYVSESQEMPGRMSVSAYIDYLRPFYPTWDRQLEAEILSRFRLPPGRAINALSHGMRLKMALACALPYRPRLLVLDEPFSGLDPLARDELLDGLKLRGDGTTILISSHELAEVEELATHVAFVDSGQVQFQEALGDLKARLREVQVILAEGAVLPAQLPADWLAARKTGNVLRFVDTRFCERDLAARIAAVLGDVVGVETRPVALRSIYTTLAGAAAVGGVQA